MANVLHIVAVSGQFFYFAAQSDRGLMVPSIRNADKLSARELDAEIRRLTAVVREVKATPEELGSGTFTLNNYCVFGVDGSVSTGSTTGAGFDRLNHRSRFRLAQPPDRLACTTANLQLCNMCSCAKINA